MAEIMETTTIACSAEHVWAALEEFGTISHWAPNVDHSCLTTDRAEGVGCERRVQVGRNALLERVVVWQVGEQLAYVIDGFPPVVRSAVNSWKLQASGSSTTVVTLTTQVDVGPRPPQQLVARLLSKAMAKASREMLGGLKANLETVRSEQVSS